MAEPAFGWYVYCIVRTDDRPSLEGLAGVDPASPGVELINERALSAVVSRVRLDEFGAAALQSNLEDLAWVERTARAHDAVLARALTVDAVVPLRMCTIFTEEGHVRDMLAREQEALLAGLERVSGHAEWSVKLLADRRQLEAAARERTPAPAAPTARESPGRAFFARKKLDRELQEEARALTQAAAADTHARLREHAADAVLLPAQHPELSRRAGAMVLNRAYLVHRGQAERFAAVARELDMRHRVLGLRLELTGPWAPYNFASAAEVRRER